MPTPSSPSPSGSSCPASSARAFYVIEYWNVEYWPAFEARGLPALLGAIVNISQGGLVVYGAFFGGVLGLVLFVRKYRLPVLALGDLIAPSLLLGLALGRIGCTLNGCCFGAVCPHSWAVEFPWGSPPHVRQAEHGDVFLHGLKLPRDPDGPPLIAAVESGSEAERLGLRAEERLVESTAARSRRRATPSWRCSTRTSST